MPEKKQKKRKKHKRKILKNDIETKNESEKILLIFPRFLSEIQKMHYQNKLFFLPTKIGVCVRCTEKEKLLFVDTCQTCFVE